MKLIKRQERDTPIQQDLNLEDNKVVATISSANTDDRIAEMEKKLAEMQEMLVAKDEKIAKLEGAKGGEIDINLGGKEYKIFVKTNFYSHIDTSVVNDARLNDKSDVYAKLLYVVLCEQTISRSKVTISNNLLAIKINASVSTVKKAVNRLESLRYITVERNKKSKAWNTCNTYTVNHVTEFPVAEHSAFFDSAKKFIERHNDEIEKLGTNELHFRRWRGTNYTDPDIVLDPEYHNVEGITGNKFQKADINTETGEFKADNSKKKRGKENGKAESIKKRNYSGEMKTSIKDWGNIPSMELSFREGEDKHFRDKYSTASGWTFNVEGKNSYTVDKAGKQQEVFAEAMASYIENGVISNSVEGDIDCVKMALKYMGYDTNNVERESSVTIKD